MTYEVHPDISIAHTLPGSFYFDQGAFKKARDGVFARSWQVVDQPVDRMSKSEVRPFTLLPGFLNEPLMLICDNGHSIKCLSNVCTHRGNVLVQKAGPYPRITCDYHGRCFDLEGKMTSMPGFKGVENFPAPKDDLRRFVLTNLGPITFTCLSDPPAWDPLQQIKERMSWFPFEDLQLEKSLSRDYQLEAHWALYCENYLEGFHIPFVHQTLNKKLDFQAYGVDLYPDCSVQVGIADKDETCFELPNEHADAGQNIYAYYWWLFPNTMINVYTWGVSLNIVKPVGLSKTEIAFRTYLLPGMEASHFASTGLHETEMEDEEIVLQVQKGVGSRAYDRGRFSVEMEKGVHHFQMLLAGSINEV